MNSIRDQENLDKKKVLLRLDLNVPLRNGSITDETRINKIIPIINFLIRKQSKIIIISHIGRPKGKVNNDLSLKPICDNVEKKIDKKIRLIKENIFKLKKEDLFKNENDQIVFLENIRFYEEEEKNDTNFAKHLARLGDLYVNDAFSCSHRSHASISKITEFLPSFAGLQFETEINALKRVTSEIKRPVTCIIGGSKISTKINIIKNLIPKFKNIIFVGGMANNILQYKGYQVGKSIKEQNCDYIIDDIFSLAKKNDCNIIFPSDVSVGKHINDKATNKELDEIKEDDLILDIGKNYIENIKLIIDKTKTIFWNGPAGYFENENFSNGTISIAKKISQETIKNSLISIVGGGDTLAAIKNNDLKLKYTHLSTAGGAFLEYIEGKNLPGIEVLK